VKEIYQDPDKNLVESIQREIVENGEKKRRMERSSSTNDDDLFGLGSYHSTRRKTNKLFIEIVD
jgi:hypothetical protein